MVQKRRKKKGAGGGGGGERERLSLLPKRGGGECLSGLKKWFFWGERESKREMVMWEIQRPLQEGLSWAVYTTLK